MTQKGDLGDFFRKILYGGIVSRKILENVTSPENFQANSSVTFSVISLTNFSLFRNGKKS